jgi:putative PIN family toxin of toxin-antitoxin system
VRIVIDTNVLISAIFWTGKPKQLLNRVRHQVITFVTSNDLLDELKRILMRRDKPFRLSGGEADQVVEAMRELSEVVKIHSRINVCHDEMDNKVLACAIDGKAEYIISGDIHLLRLGSFKGIRIMSVPDFLDQTKQAQ